jgi:hypothetical protein
VGLLLFLWLLLFLVVFGLVLWGLFLFGLLLGFSSFGLALSGLLLGCVVLCLLLLGILLFFGLYLWGFLCARMVVLPNPTRHTMGLQIPNRRNGTNNRLHSHKHGNNPKRPKKSRNTNPKKTNAKAEKKPKIRERLASRIRLPSPNSLDGNRTIRILPNNNRKRKHEPTLNVGDIAIVISTPTKAIKIGDIIQYYTPQTGEPTIHRVIDKYESRRLNMVHNPRRRQPNAPDDPINERQITGKVILTIPKLGWISIYLKEFSRQRLHIPNSDPSKSHNRRRHIHTGKHHPHNSRPNPNRIRIPLIHISQNNKKGGRK